MWDFLVELGNSNIDNAPVFFENLSVFFEQLGVVLFGVVIPYVCIFFLGIFIFLFLLSNVIIFFLDRKYKSDEQKE